MKKLWKICDFGKIWPIPITLDVSKEFADTVKPKQDIALRDQEGVILAILSISDKWMPNKKREAHGKYLAQ